MEEKKYKSVPFIVTLVIGALLWVIFILQEELAKYGLYQVVSYHFHEVAALLPMLCMLISLILSIYFLVRWIKKHSDTAEKILLLVFVICFIAQFAYFYHRSNFVSGSVMCTVEEVYEQEDIIIVSVEGRDQTIKMECPMLVRKMLVEKDQRYFITYEWHKDNPNEGELHIISLAKQGD